MTVLKPGSDAHAAAVTKAVTKKKKPEPRKRNNDADWWPADEGGDSDSGSDDSDFEDVAPKKTKRALPALANHTPWQEEEWQERRGCALADGDRRARGLHTLAG